MKNAYKGILNLTVYDHKTVVRDKRVQNALMLYDTGCSFLTLFISDQVVGFAEGLHSL